MGGFPYFRPHWSGTERGNLQNDDGELYQAKCIRNAGCRYWRNKLGLGYKPDQNGHNLQKIMNATSQLYQNLKFTEKRISGIRLRLNIFTKSLQTKQYSHDIINNNCVVTDWMNIYIPVHTFLPTSFTRVYCLRNYITSRSDFQAAVFGPEEGTKEIPQNIHMGKHRQIKYSRSNHACQEPGTSKAPNKDTFGNRNE